uniref:Conserved oligomeric Golgi complex subunit 7 n=1 Tax=Trichuris muris TaxID=70415 RepID=A0A5S6Q791_TRIMR
MATIESSDFADKEFDVVQWLNVVLGDDQEEVALLERSRTLLRELEHFSEQVDRQWENVASEAADLVPSLSSELRIAEQTASQFPGHVDDFRGQLDSMDLANAQIIQDLIRINRAKCNFDSLRKSLADVDSWKSLVGEIETVFGSGDCATISDHLLKMQSCLEQLAEWDTDLSAKKRYMEEVKDQFVSVVSPGVIGAFTTHSSDSLAYFGQLFDSLNRRSDLESFFTSYMKRQLANCWQKVFGGVQPQTLVQLLQSFHNVIVETWFEEVKNLKLLINVSDELVCNAFESCLADLSPAIGQLVTPMTASSSQDVKICKELLITTVKAVECHCQQAPFVRRFRLSSRLYELLAPLLTSYQQQVTSRLLEQLNKLYPERVTWSTFGHNFFCSSEIFAAIHSSLDTSVALFGPLVLPCVCKAADVMLCNYLTHVEKSLTLLTKDDSTDMKNMAKQTSRLLQVPLFSGKLSSLSLRLEVALVACLEQFSEKMENSGKEPREPCASSSANQWTPFDSAIFGNEQLRCICDQFVDRLANHDCAKSMVEFHLDSLLPGFGSKLRKLSDQLARSTIDAIFGPVKHILAEVHLLKSWWQHGGDNLRSDLPVFSFIAQEYVTFLGQYLLTLAHNLEPFFPPNDAELSLAFRGCSIPYLSIETTVAEAAARRLLECAGRGTAIHFVETIGALRAMTTFGQKQMLADAEYLCNLLEDLGILVPDELVSLMSSTEQMVK